MKTTLDLPDDLLIAAKQVAVQRRTTLRELVAKSLRREIGLDQPEPPAADSSFEIGPLGLPVLKRKGPARSVEDYQAIIDRIQQEEDARDLPGSAR